MFSASFSFVSASFPMDLGVFDSTGLETVVAFGVFDSLDLETVVAFESAGLETVVAFDSAGLETLVDAADFFLPFLVFGGVFNVSLDSAFGCCLDTTFFGLLFAVFDSFGFETTIFIVLDSAAFFSAAGAGAAFLLETFFEAPAVLAI